jgi:hypothetical protein
MDVVLNGEEKEKKDGSRNLERPLHHVIQLSPDHPSHVPERAVRHAPVLLVITLSLS